MGGKRITIEQVKQIKDMTEHGASVAEIASYLHISEVSVRKYARNADKFLELGFIPRKRKSLIDESTSELIRKKWIDGASITDLSDEFNVSVSAIHLRVAGLRRPEVLPEPKNGELWSDVPGFEGTYLISSLGRLYRTGMGRLVPAFIKPAVDKSGYYYVQLRNKSNKKMAFIHRLVAQAFCDGFDDEHNVVNHIDGNKTNNCCDNLEWCSVKDNTDHAIVSLHKNMGGTAPFSIVTTRTIPVDADSMRSPSRKFTDEEVVAIRSDARSNREIARQYGVNKCTIQRLRAGVTYRDVK